MTDEKCPKCGGDYPEHIAYAGGNYIIKTTCRCRKCGHRYIHEYDCNTKQSVIKNVDTP